MSLAIAAAGCGKKITEGSTADISGVQIENQVRPRLYTLELSGSEASFKRFPHPQNAEFYLPESILVRSGNPYQKQVEITFDIDPYDNDQYQYKCSYRRAGYDTRMDLVACVNSSNQLMNLVGYPLTLNRNEILELRFAGASSQDLAVEAVFEMLWR
jgi:hypothetical protein